MGEKGMKWYCCTVLCTACGSETAGNYVQTLAFSSPSPPLAFFLLQLLPSSSPNLINLSNEIQASALDQS